jgi:hypothetical protein
MKTTWCGGVVAVAMGLGLMAGCSEVPDREEPGALGQQEQGVDLAPDPARELVITDLSVVEGNKFTTYKAGKKNTDPEGAWTIGRLLENQLPAAQRTPAGASAFAFGWLRQWETDQTINGQVVPGRPAIRALLIDPWKTASGCDTTAPDASCTLDMGKAPFRLLAIVNRPDLRDLPDGSDPGTGGEGRFVFGALGPTGNALQFTVIFEYKLPVRGSLTAKKWAENWHALGKHPFGGKYNDELHKVAQEFTRVDAGGPGQSALSQIRTNEASLALAGTDPPNLPSTKLWELREFVRATDPATGQIVLAGDTVKQEPALGLSGTAALGAWATANQAAILDGTYAVPATLDGRPILASSSIAPFSFVWDIPGVSPQVRDALALGTCNGCHTNETGTVFTHIKPRQPGAVAALSTFLADQEAVGGPRYTDFVDLLTSPVVKPGPAKDHKKPKKPRP